MWAPGTCLVYFHPRGVLLSCSHVLKYFSGANQDGKKECDVKGDSLQKHVLLEQKPYSAKQLIWSTSRPLSHYKQTRTYKQNKNPPRALIRMQTGPRGGKRLSKCTCVSQLDGI